MKVAIYIVDGTTQLVLTPDGAWEKNVIKEFGQGHEAVKIMKGSFYECAGNNLGGWYREGGTEESLILRIDDTPEIQPTALSTRTTKSKK